MLIPFSLNMEDKIIAKKKAKEPFFASFIKSQASSAVSTVFDFGTAGILFYIFRVHYIIASPAGNIAGAIVSFYLGRNWAFKRKDGKITHQAMRYALTSFMSAVINTAGIAFLVENFNVDEGISKAVVALIVGATFNFMMFRYFVYK